MLPMGVLGGAGQELPMTPVPASPSEGAEGDGAGLAMGGRVVLEGGEFLPQGSLRPLPHGLPCVFPPPGVSRRTQKFGTFPGNYVAPV